MSLYFRTRRYSVKRYNAETLALRDNIALAGGTISDASLTAADHFVTACKNTAVFSKLLDVGLFVGDQLTAALVKLVSGSGNPNLTNHGFLAGDYTEQGVNGGLTPDGASKYLDTGLQASDAGAESLAFYSRAAADDSQVWKMMGGIGEHAFEFERVAGADQFLNTDGAVMVARANTPGFYVGTPNALFVNAKLIGGAIAPATPLDNVRSVYVFGTQKNAAIDHYWPTLGSFYAIGTALTAADVANLYSAVQTLQSNLNRNV